MTSTDNTELLAALRLARVYVQKVAATMPFEAERVRRQRQAVQDLRLIDAAIMKASA